MPQCSPVSYIGVVYAFGTLVCYKQLVKSIQCCVYTGIGLGQWWLITPASPLFQPLEHIHHSSLYHCIYKDSSMINIANACSHLGRCVWLPLECLGILFCHAFHGSPESHSQTRAFIPTSNECWQAPLVAMDAAQAAHTTNGATAGRSLASSWRCARPLAGRLLLW